MRVTTINVPEKYLKFIKQLTDSNIYASRAEVIRVAIREWIITESKLYSQFIDPFIETEDINTIRVPNGDGTYQQLFRLGEA